MLDVQGALVSQRVSQRFWHVLSTSTLISRCQNGGRHLPPGREHYPPQMRPLSWIGAIPVQGDQALAVMRPDTFRYPSARFSQQVRATLTKEPVNLCEGRKPYGSTARVPTRQASNDGRSFSTKAREGKILPHLPLPSFRQFSVNSTLPTRISGYGSFTCNSLLYSRDEYLQRSF